MIETYYISLLWFILTMPTTYECIAWQREACADFFPELGNDSLHFWPLQNSPANHPLYSPEGNHKIVEQPVPCCIICVQISADGWLLINVGLLWYSTIPGTSPRNNLPFKSLSQDCKPSTQATNHWLNSVVTSLNMLSFKQKTCPSLFP